MPKGGWCNGDIGWLEGHTNAPTTMNKVLKVLETALDPLSEGDILRALGWDKTAHMRVSMVLTRLHNKGMLERYNVRVPHNLGPAHGVLNNYCYLLKAEYLPGR